MGWTPVKFNTFDPMHWISDKDHLIWREVEFTFNTKAEIEYQDKYLWYAGDLPGSIFNEYSNPPDTLETDPRPDELRVSELGSNWIISDKPDIEIYVQSLNSDGEWGTPVKAYSRWFNYYSYTRTITLDHKQNNYPESWEYWYVEPEEEEGDSYDYGSGPVLSWDKIREWEVYARYWYLEETGEYLWNDGLQWIISPQLGCGTEDTFIGYEYHGNMGGFSELGLVSAPRTVMPQDWDVSGVEEFYVPKKDDLDSFDIYEGHASIKNQEWVPDNDQVPDGAGRWKVYWTSLQDKLFLIRCYKHGYVGDSWWSNPYLEGVYQGRGNEHTDGGQNRSLRRVYWKLEGYVRDDFMSCTLSPSPSPSPSPSEDSTVEALELPEGRYKKFVRTSDVKLDGRVIEDVSYSEEFYYVGKLQWRDQFNRVYTLNLMNDEHDNPEYGSIHFEKDQWVIGYKGSFYGWYVGPEPTIQSVVEFIPMKVDDGNNYVVDNSREALQIEWNNIIIGNSTLSWNVTQNINPGDNAQWSDLPPRSDRTGTIDEFGYSSYEYDPKYRSSDIYSMLESQAEVVQRNWSNYMTNMW